MAAAASPAAAQDRNHRFAVTVSGKLAESQDRDRASLRGRLRGRPFRRGRARISFEFLEPGGSLGLLRFRLIGRRGSITGWGTLGSPDGGAAFSGVGGAATGSRRYKGATGVLRITGTYNTGTGVLTLRLRGTVRY